MRFKSLSLSLFVFFSFTCLNIPLSFSEDISDFTRVEAKHGCLSSNLIQYVVPTSVSLTRRYRGLQDSSFINLLRDTVACLNVEVQFARKGGEIFRINPYRQMSIPGEPYLRIEELATHAFVASLYEAREFFPDIKCVEISNRYGDDIHCTSPLWRCKEKGASIECADALADPSRTL